MSSAADVKRALRDAGFEIYRTRDDVVHLAERVRENLIMDAGVRVHAAGPRVAFYARAQLGDFPGEGDDDLFDRARHLGAPAVARGYTETRAFVTELPDPGDPERILDRWCQVQFDKAVGNIGEALEEARFAMALDKTATR